MLEVLIVSFIKSMAMNLTIFYAANRITNNKIDNRKWGWFIVYNIFASTIYINLNGIINPMILWLVVYVLNTLFLKAVSKSDIRQVLISVLIGYALALISFVVGGMISFLPYKMFYGENAICGTLSSVSLQTILIYLFFKIKRFKNGFSLFNKKEKFEKMKDVLMYLSICIVILASFIGSVFSEIEDIMKNTIISFGALSIIMYIMIHRTITMQYKHSLLLKTLEEYKEEIASKDKEIEKLSAEKFNTSKIRHEFYNRQKALELMVKQNISGDIDVNGVSENILNIVNELTAEYSKECEVIKGLNVLPKTDVVEIDNMFKYMQTECAKKNIEFKLNIQDSIHPLINNHISKNRLETLLGDHIRNAINVLDKSDIDDKEILVVLGLKDGNYEICILDNGAEFSIDVLLKLGKEQVTTGGTGIGFLTTFETLKETKASLVITEYESSEYTKSVSFVFNNKCEYVINSYRAKEIMSKNDRKEIIINEI